MSGRPALERGSKLGRALYTLVDVSQKLDAQIRTRVARIRNAIESDPEDPALVHKLDSDLSALLKDARLNSAVVALRKALRRL